MLTIFLITLVTMLHLIDYGQTGHANIVILEPCKDWLRMKSTISMTI